MNSNNADHTFGVIKVLLSHSLFAPLTISTILRRWLPDSNSGVASDSVRSVFANLSKYDKKKSLAKAVSKNLPVKILNSHPTINCFPK